MSDLTCLEIATIQINKQPVNQEKVDDYADLMAAPVPAKFPPIVVRMTPSGPVLVDGRHRLAARKQLGFRNVLARITL